MDSSMIMGLVRMILALVVIVPSAFYVTRWYGRKHTEGQNLRVKEALALGSNRILYVVEWEDKRYLLGVTNQTITRLDHKLDAQRETEEVTE
jgi:flagellar biogenesis protein FliO